MRSKTRNSLSLAIAVLFLSLLLLPIGSSALAQPPGGGAEFQGQGEAGEQRARRGGPGGRGGERGERIAEFLDLTEDQQEAWKAVHEDSREAAEDLFSRMRENRQALQAAVEAGNDEELIGSLTLEGRDLRQEMKAHREAVDAQLVALLDDEQRVKFEALKELRSERGPRGERRGRGGKHRGGQRGQ